MQLQSVWNPRYWHSLSLLHGRLLFTVDTLARGSWRVLEDIKPKLGGIPSEHNITDREAVLESIFASNPVGLPVLPFGEFEKEPSWYYFSPDKLNKTIAQLGHSILSQPIFDATVRLHIERNILDRLRDE